MSATNAIATVSRVLVDLTVFMEASRRDVGVLRQIPQANDRRVCRVGAIDISEHERAGLDDTVDNSRVECKIVDPERLVEIREGQRHLARQAMPDIEVELLQ